jgi:glycosyltransferase involved in cell wall biosynthesis
MTGDRPLRVLSIIGQLNVGGAETYLSRIAQSIRKYNVYMEVCALDRVGLRIADLEQAGIVVHGTPFGTNVPRSNTLRLLKTIDVIRRMVRTGRFDIVHTYLYWSDILGVPGARLAGCKRIIVGRRALHAWIHDHKVLYHAMEQFTNTLANEVIANSQAGLRDAIAHEAFLPRVRTVIYNGIDVSAYEPAAGSTSGPLRIVTVGALAPRKGQEYAIEAMKLVTAAGVDAKLVLVGSGADEAMLRRLSAGSGVAERITFAGEHTDPRPFLSPADVFLLPSRQEGFSNAILEARACGLPVIATDVGGNAEAIVQNKGGLIVEPQKPEAIAAAIAALAGSRDALPEMGRFNRERVAELFSLDASARNLADWYFREPSAVGSGHVERPEIPSSSVGDQ